MEEVVILNLFNHCKLVILVVNVIFFSLSAFAGAEPLNDAAKEGNLDEIKRLINEGANIEIRDASASTPLFNALDNGNKEVVKFLILKGADVNPVGKRGITPMMEAKNRGAKDYN